MSATETFRFGPYTLRPAGGGKMYAHDLHLAHFWTKADPDHRDSVDYHFWLEQGQNSDAYLLLDNRGPLYFARLILTAPHPDWRAVEMHIQFPPEPPDQTERDQLHLRVAMGLIKGLAWLERVLQGISVREIHFDSSSPSLIRFSTQKLGFRDQGHGKLLKTL